MRYRPVFMLWLFTLFVAGTATLPAHTLHLNEQDGSWTFMMGQGDTLASDNYTIRWGDGDPLPGGTYTAPNGITSDVPNDSYFTYNAAVFSNGEQFPADSSTSLELLGDVNTNTVTGIEMDFSFYQQIFIYFEVTSIQDNFLPGFNAPDDVYFQSTVGPNNPLFVTSTPVPEPASGALLAAGAALLALRRRLPFTR